MNNTPLVSILMTAYNRESYLAEAIESVLKSTYYNFELIIVDDCSKDNTSNIAKSFAMKDDRVLFIQNEKNLGDYPNRNNAASYARGEYMTYVDSDDMLYPDTIEKIIRIVSKDEDFNFAMYWPHSDEHFVLKGEEALKIHFFEKQFLYIGPGGTFMRRTFFEKVGKYPELYGPANDMYFNLKICCHSSIHLMPFEFFYYRRHEGQEINNHFGYLYQNFNYMRDALKELPLPFTLQQKKWLIKKNKRRFTYNLFNYFWNSKNFRKTKEAYLKANFNFIYLIQSIFQF